MLAPKANISFVGLSLLSCVKFKKTSNSLYIYPIVSLHKFNIYPINNYCIYYIYIYI